MIAVRSFVCATILVIICHQTRSQIAKLDYASCEASSRQAEDVGCKMALDGDPLTVWAADSTQNEWLKITFKAPVEIQKIRFLASNYRSEQVKRIRLDFDSGVPVELDNLKENYQDQNTHVWDDRIIVPRTTTTVTIHILEVYQYVNQGNGYNAFAEVEFLGSVVAVKKKACVAVAVDVSESIEGDGPVNEEDSFLKELWTELFSSPRLQAYHQDVVVFPFNAVALLKEVHYVSTRSYSTAAEFVAAQEGNWNQALHELKKRDREDLTNLGAVFAETVSLQCVADVNLFIIVSDYINTAGNDKFDSSLQQLLDNNFKVFGVLLSKEHDIVKFNKVKQASGLSLTLSGSEWRDQLEQLLDGVYASAST